MIKLENKKNILILGWKPYYKKEFLNKISKLANIKIIDKKNLTEEEILKEIKDVNLILNNSSTYISKKIIKYGKNIICIIVAGVGYEQIDIESATENGIVVVNTPSADDVVAEGTILFMIALAKQFPKIIDAAKKGTLFPKYEENIELFGKTLGLIGVGRIGSRVVNIANAMGMTVIAYDPYISEQYSKLIKIKLVSLKNLLSESDFVSIHCPLTKETYQMIGEEEFNLMKKTSFLINTSRGKIVEENALYRHLKKGEISGAALDVFNDEPLKPDNPLLALNNTICTAHSISGSIERAQRIEKMVLENILRVIKGTLPKYIVNPEVLNRIIQTN